MVSHNKNEITFKSKVLVKILDNGKIPVQLLYYHNNDGFCKMNLPSSCPRRKLNVLFRTVSLLEDKNPGVLQRPQMVSIQKRCLRKTSEWINKLQ